MRVGLVIVTFNAAAFIGRALAAVGAQTRPPDSTIIVDNASTDETLAVIAEETGAWPQPPRVIRESRNLGFAAANNRAVARLPDCELVALLNPDAFPDPGWLAALLAAAAAHPEAASFASRGVSRPCSRLPGPDRRPGRSNDCRSLGPMAWSS